ncbi:hypothetical protein DAH66_09750 [Sphingomonas koreensis]|uniref:DUF4325 domain-containing protein n=1 Tax=Sphingomonas koreensis TaxID=93064 RepID=A0A430G4E1_9SPHN|nr:STAS-like domain-containing protein [Sphingomonas koreensis]RSY85967.1 hypothetical protein DAH66_09750 [Sphingomonas koreensis]
MGRQMLALLISETKAVSEASVAFLDFDGVDIATGSFLREAVLGFRDFSRNAIGILYPVVANANAAIEEELSDYLADRTDAMWACGLNGAGAISDPHVLGVLDSAHAKTLRFIVERHPISAPELAKLYPDEGIGPTAWNNRLATLSAKGIVMELKSGKTKTFTPVLDAV